MTFLTSYYDPNLTLIEGLTPGKITAEEQRRLSRQVAVIQAAAKIPRRLGPESAPEDMALDKKRCRRVAHALEQPLAKWGGSVNSATDINSDAARLDWPTWTAEQRVYINNRIRYIATMGILQPGNLSWAKQAVTRLQNELQLIEYAIR
jgi:hypothetical protein